MRLKAPGNEVQFLGARVRRTNRGFAASTKADLLDAALADAPMLVQAWTDGAKRDRASSTFQSASAWVIRGIHMCGGEGGPDPCFATTV